MRVASFLGNQAASTSRMLVLLARDIEAAEDVTGWTNVRRRLTDPDTADPALLQLELGGRALGKGFQVSFEPPGRKSHRADLRLQIGSTTVNVECTSIRAFPEASDEANRISWTICPFIKLGDLGLHVGGTATGPFTEEELQQLAAHASTFYELSSQASFGSQASSYGPRQQTIRAPKPSSMPMEEGFSSPSGSTMTLSRVSSRPLTANRAVDSSFQMIRRC